MYIQQMRRAFVMLYKLLYTPPQARIYTNIKHTYTDIFSISCSRHAMLFKAFIIHYTTQYTPYTLLHNTTYTTKTSTI